jgi:DNA-binding CsgD family transcriptional regulator/predicted negative regulator of RcsB-dependent stress response
MPPLPALIVVEDAHWCDNTSFDFLLFLARKIVQHPILLLITYRDNEVSAPLARLLAALDRERLALEMRLARLTKPQTEVMVRTIFTLPRPVQEDFLDALYNLTEGNPFFIEEILKSCVASGDIFQVGGQWGRKLLSELHIPRSVQVAVRQRVEQLTLAAQELLKQAAVIGQRFDFSLLQQVSHHDEGTLVALLKELMAAQLLVEEGADRFAFRHALTRQAVYFMLLARERRTLHRIVAETIEQLPGSQTRLPELAYHFYRAEEWRKCWQYARRAGEGAQMLFAPRAAIEHFSHALEAAQHLSSQSSDESNDFESAPLYSARGAAYETLGDFEAARADFEEALALARMQHKSQDEWQSLLNLGFLWTSRDFGRAGEHLQEALAVARALDDPAILAHSLNRVGNWYVNNEQPYLGRHYHSEALAIFQSLGDQVGLAATLDLLVGATHLAGDPLQSMRYYEQAVTLLRRLNEQRGLTSCLTWLTFRGPIAINLLTPAAPLPECIQAAEDAIHLAREIQWRPGEAFAMMALAFALGESGEYGKALPLVESAIVLAQEIEHRWDTVGYITLGALYLDLGLSTKGQAVLEQGRAVAEEHDILFSLRNSTSLLAAAYLAQGQSTKARVTLTSLFGDEHQPFLSQGEAPPTMAQRLYWLVVAEIALHEGRANDALAIVEQLLVTSGEEESSPEKAVARLYKVRGDVLLALGRTDEAEQTWQYALQAATLQGARPLSWRIHQALGQLYRARGERNEATAHFDAARTLIDTVAATLPPSLCEQFLAYALAKLPAPATLTPLRARKLNADGLTAREVEVAQLIQQGNSDREIAARLSLSKRTVSTHVSNILTKLDFSTRAQIAAWVVTKGL